MGQSNPQSWLNPLPTKVDHDWNIILQSLTKWLQQPTFPFGAQIGLNQTRAGYLPSSPPTTYPVMAGTMAFGVVPLLQGGSPSLTASGGTGLVSVTFPVAYPNTVDSLVVTGVGFAGWGRVWSWTNSTATFELHQSTGAVVANGTYQVSYIVIGH